MWIKLVEPRRDDEWNRAMRGEEPHQRADRNFVELLGELRVMQTGVQILFALLLTVAFTGSFADADRFQRVVYVVTLVCCAVATALLIAPVAYHRAMFQRGRKAELVVAAHRLLRLGLTVLVIAVVGSLLLVVDEAVGRVAALVIAASVGVVFVGLVRAARPQQPPHSAAAERDRRTDRSRPGGTASPRHSADGDRGGEMTEMRSGPDAPAAETGAKTSAAAAFALVFGVAALLTGLTGLLAPVAVVLGVLGLVLGVIGMVRGKRPHRTGRGVAISGLVLSLLGLVLGVIVLAGVVTVLNNEQAVERIERQLDQVRDRLTTVTPEVPTPR